MSQPTTVFGAVEDSEIVYDETGATFRVIEFADSHPHDHITIRFDVDDAVPWMLRVYDDEERTSADEPSAVEASSRSEDATEPVASYAFERQHISFTPISVIGRSESSMLEGVSVSGDTNDSIPSWIDDVWKMIGFTVVPEGGEWQI